jgi:CHAT domain-containing protein/tetratricopeptide (TPR) repeat protein
VTISIDTWVEAALNTDSAELALLMEGLPPSYHRADAVVRAQRPSLAWRISAFILVGGDHAYSDDLELSVSLNTAGIRLCKRATALRGPVIDDVDRDMYGGIICVAGIWSLAKNVDVVYARTGRFEDQIAVLKDALEWLEIHDLNKKYRYILADSLAHARLNYADLLFAQGRLEEAQSEWSAAPQGLDTEAVPPYGFYCSYHLMKDKLDKFLIPATERKDTRTDEEINADGMKRLEEVFSMNLPKVVQAVPISTLPVEKVAEYTELYGEFGEMAYQSEEESRKFQQEHEGKVDNGMIEYHWQLTKKFLADTRYNEAYRKGVALILDPRSGYDPVQLDQLRQKFEVFYQESKDDGQEDRVIDTSWMLSVCYNRLGRHDEETHMLQFVRTWINQHRVLISDPLKRAATSMKYPYLHNRLSDRLWERGEHAELLTVIEEAKGRTLVDMLAVQAGQENRLVDTVSVSAWLPGLMTKLGSHYVTFLTGEEVTYAVCVTRHGTLHAARLPAGEKLLDALRDDLDPYRWGRKTNGFFAAPDDVPQQLNSFVDWLGELVDAGVLQLDDHICYSPDDLLHLVPLHYVDFRGAPLVKWFSLSRTHSAVLLHHFAQEAYQRPTGYLSVKVPLADEADNDPQKVAKLGRVSEWLAVSSLPGTRLDDEGADLQALESELAAKPLENMVVHFATHGCFPRQGEAADPFRSSGLVLSRNGRLPSGARNCGLFSPERIIERGSPFKFNGAHLSLQACVSGLSEEGRGGDLLGLEWSLLMAGAQSVLSTHWNVPVDSSADFCIRFYEEWLLNGQSRAQAWRKAVLTQLGDHPFFDGGQAHHWAAFSLAGDWR